MGRALDSAEIQNLSEMIHVPISIERIDDKDPHAGSASGRSAIFARSGTSIRAIDEDSLAAHEVLNDIYGRPAVILRITLQRTIYEQGQTTLLQFSLLLLAAGLDVYKRQIINSPRPFTLPGRFDSVTSPLTYEPAGIATCPSIITGNKVSK